MSTQLAIINGQELDTIQRVGKLLAASGYFDGRGDSPQAIAQMATKILAGRELGFGPFASVNGVHLIQGKPSIGANLMASAVKASGRYDYRVRELTNDTCRIEFFQRTGDTWESIGISSFDATDARKASTKNMDKFARNMLFARAMSNGVRWYTPDIFAGNAVYVPEELGADVDSEGNVVEASYTVTEPARAVDTTTDANTSPAASVQATDENFGMGVQYERTDNMVGMEDSPTDDILAIISEWRGPGDAQIWAVKVEACANEHHARESWINSVRACKGYTDKNKAEVFTHFAKHQLEKLAAQPAMVAA